MTYTAKQEIGMAGGRRGKRRGCVGSVEVLKDMIRNWTGFCAYVIRMRSVPPGVCAARCDVTKSLACRFWPIDPRTLKLISRFVYGVRGRAGVHTANGDDWLLEWMGGMGTSRSLSKPADHW